MSDFFSDYFIRPIWEHTGYNLVNTLAYALIALAAAYLIYKAFQKFRIAIDKEFLLAILPFILLGSTMRVVTDSIDTQLMQAYAANNAGSFVSGIYSAIISSHALDYGYLTVTPGIYIVTAALFLAVLAICHSFGKREIVKYVGFALWLPFLLLLVPMMSHWAYPVIAIVVAVAAYFGAKAAFARFGVKDELAPFVVFAHALDGAATFVTIDLFNKLEPACAALGKCYGEQHVLSAGLGNVLGFTGYGYLLFLLVKILFSGAAAYIVAKDNAPQSEKNYIFLLLIIFGLAPGIRDCLRVLTGA
jgi:uncharacterized membrane protein